MNAWSRASILFGATVSLLLAAVAGINVVVDPYDIMRSAPIKGINGYLPSLIFQSGLSKAFGVRRETFDTLILGSSVADGGFAVTGGTIFDSNRLAGRPVPKLKNIYNSAVRGSGVDAALVYLRHAYAVNPHIKHVILGLEWGLFTARVKPHPHWDPFLRPGPLWRTGYFKYLTWTALDDSVRTVQANRGYAARDGLRGLLRLGQLAGPDAALAAEVVQQVSLKSRALPIVARSPSETRAIYFSMLQSARFRGAADAGPNNLARRDILDIVRQIVEFTRQNNIKLTVYVSPQHAAHWATARAMGLWPYHLDWLRQLAGVTSYYDFSGIVDFSNDVDKYFTEDSLHFGSSAGDRMLPILLGEGGAENADYVTRDTAEAAIARRTERLEAWLKKDAYVGAVLAGIRPPMNRTDIEDILPASLSGSANGLSIVKFAGEYYGLPANQEPFDLRRVAQRQYTPMLVAKTPEEIRSEIARRNLRAFGLVRVREKGHPIASDGDATRLSDNNTDPLKFWISSLPDGAGAWAGYAFDAPTAVRRVVIVQSPNAVYRHEWLMVQASRDGGATWQNVLPAPQNLFERARGIVNIPESAGAATHWRVIAPARQPSDPKVTWVVYELELYKADNADADSSSRSSTPTRPNAAH